VAASQHVEQVSHTTLMAGAMPSDPKEET